MARFFFQNIIRFYGTRVHVTSFTPTRNVRPSLSLADFYKTYSAQHHCVSPKLGTKCGKYDYKFVDALK